MGKFRPSHSWFNKFRFAGRGLISGIRDQTSFQIHLPVALVVIAMAVLLKRSFEQIAILILAIGLVVASELLNSSIEHLASAVTEDHDRRIERALDVAAGAVLAASLIAAVIGFLILGPPLLEWLGRVEFQPNGF